MGLADRSVSHKGGQDWDALGSQTRRPCVSRSRVCFWRVDQRGHRASSTIPSFRTETTAPQLRAAPGRLLCGRIGILDDSQGLGRRVIGGIPPGGADRPVGADPVLLCPALIRRVTTPVSDPDRSRPGASYAPASARQSRPVPAASSGGHRRQSG